jgi:acetyl-CoA carboxylase biotin carboxyl carrier protein
MSKFEINEDAVRMLGQLLDEMGLSEIEYEHNDQKIRVSRQVSVAAPLGPLPTAGAAPSASAPDGEDAIPASAVVSPMVGTVYVAAEPNTPPFIQVGDMVQEGQTLLIIEAMKVMNPLPSPRAGKVTAIYVSNGDPIEFGEPLVNIE